MKPVITDPERIDEVLSKGVKEIFPSREKLKELMMSGKRIRLYTGIDPTADFIHMGHMIWMKKLAQFQELGHEVIFLIGGFTAMIGDPDKKYSREPLTKVQVENNFKNYKADASRILNFDDPENPVKGTKQLRLVIQTYFGRLDKYHFTGDITTYIES
jgi:tyrosyl-tRNA synthetase